MKLVRENIEFKRGRDIHSALGVGYKHFSDRWQNAGWPTGEAEKILLELLREVEPSITIRRGYKREFDVYFFYWDSPKGNICLIAGKKGNIKLCGSSIIFGNIIEDPIDVLENFRYFYESMDKLSESVEFRRGGGGNTASKLGVGISTIVPFDDDFRMYPNKRTLPEEAIQYLMNPALKDKIITGLHNQPDWTIDYQVRMLNELIKNDGGMYFKDLYPLRGIPKKTMGRIFKELQKNNTLRFEKRGRAYYVYLEDEYLTESIEFKRGGDRSIQTKLGVGRYKIPPAEELLAGKAWADYRHAREKIEYAMQPEKSDEYRKYVKFYIEKGHITTMSGSVFDAWVDEYADELTIEGIQRAWDDTFTGGHDDSYFHIRRAKQKGIPHEKVEESIEFKRGRDIHKGLDVGIYRTKNQKIKRLLEQSDPNHWETEFDWMCERLKNILGVKTPEDIGDIVGFETDHAIENANFDISYEDLDNDFTPLEKKMKFFEELPTNTNHWELQKGKTSDGSIIYKWRVGMLDGYITRKEWLN